MFTRIRCIFALGLLAPTLAITLVGAEAPVQPAAQAAPVAEGIPVTSAEVRQACGACHPSDAQGRMSRISYRRATPENWELTIKRMLALNNAPVTTEQARVVLKYLADNHGLAPEEARPVMFDAERRVQGMQFTYAADTQTHNLCNACHSMGRVLSERRTPEEWKLLISMHRGVYPGIDGGSGSFRRGAGAPGAKAPMDLATDHLSKAFPLMSTEWSAWSAARAPMRLTGKWALSGHQTGLGPVFGEVTIEPQPGAADGFITKTTFTYAKTGQTVTRTGRGIVYAGFQWRGRATEGTGEADAWREVAMVSRDQNEISGRWFTGFYADMGLDVTLRRVVPGVPVTGTDVASLKTGTTGQTVRVYGANLPATLLPADIVLGTGITVTRVVSSTPTMLTVTVDVAGDARVGPRDVLVAGALRPSAIVVYDKVDGVQVLPRAGMARVGGIVQPKMLQQFEAVAFHNGPDGKAGTPDDLSLGIVDAKWSIEEYNATFVEDDVKYVGTLSAGGLFTPNVDGTNPERSGNRNNIGDVWVVAEFTPAGGPPVRGRAHLLVAPPLYMDWSSTEAGK
ncbi:MAG: quinohemoprotein amine dehydrogenase subunit alpha [Acidobacteria bacterium]|nr:quinohemoprotein amine dehydrogenase subunit alpha [Acidobacteriota bacterium]